jgi:signal transduction histidine kinase
VMLPLGIATGVPTIVVTAVELGAITAPLWAWAVPNPNAPAVGAALMTTTPGRLALAVVAVALLPVAERVVCGLARLQVTAARAMLGPGEHRRLVERVVQLTETRAGVVDSQAAELRRIERDLHDGAQARIVAAGMVLALAERKADSGDSAAGDIHRARLQLDNALVELRRLVRGIHPPILTDRGLHEALLALAGDSPLRVDLRFTAGRLPPAVESAAYFFVAEALANAAKHADATTCSVEVHDHADSDAVTTVRVIDDGQGGADPTGRGLAGLRRRIEALDGTFGLASPPGGPTTLQAEFRCAL